MKIACLAVAALISTAAPASAACYEWPLRQVDGHPVYDGDTIYVSLPGLPHELSAAPTRLRGIDTPERRAKCDAERYAATAARDFLEALVSTGRVLYCEPEWDKYGGRILARVEVDGAPVDATMIAAGHARAYGGGKRQGWCG